MPVLGWDRNGVQPPHGAVFVCIREIAPGSTKKEHTGGGRNERQDVLENRGRKHRDAWSVRYYDFTLREQQPPHSLGRFDFAAHATLNNKDMQST